MTNPNCHAAISRVNTALRILGFNLDRPAMDRIALIVDSSSDFDLMTAFARELRAAATPPHVQAEPQSADRMLMIVAGGYWIVLQKRLSGAWDINLRGQKFNTWTDVTSGALVVVLNLQSSQRMGKQKEIRRLLVTVYGPVVAAAFIAEWEKIHSWR